MLAELCLPLKDIMNSSTYPSPQLLPELHLLTAHLHLYSLQFIVYTAARMTLF